MNLYRSKGRIWTGTQADARAAQGGKDFEAIEVPTDKAGLLAWLNTFDVRPGDIPPVMTIPDDLELPEDWHSLGGGGHLLPDPETPGIRVAHPVGSPPPVSPDACPACVRSRRAAEMVCSAEAAICAAADVQDISDIPVLDRLIDTLQRRRAALTTPTNPLDDVLG